MKDKFNSILLIILLIIIIFLGWRINAIKNTNEDAQDSLKKSIIMNDSLTKEADGRYAKLVNYYNTEKDLKEQLKDSNKDLYNVIKKESEKILSLTNAVITLQGAVNEGFGNLDPNDSNKINLALKYPNDKESFINWNGAVDKKSAFYKGEWSFGKLPLQIVLTEEKRGLWKSRLIGPDWLKVDSMTINSIPASDYNDKQLKKLQFFVGGGYIKALSNSSNAISVGGGLSYNGYHNFLLHASTNQQVGISYYYNFQKKKKK
jgi:cell division protein FtsB